ncbi:MAG: phosphotransferase [Alphaproteobacteria bacterium]
MSRRALEIAAFLEQSDWAEADQFPIEADFSPRRYARLDRADGKRAILMDADPDQHTDSFVDIALLLKSMDISAPEIYAAHDENGLVIMEYLGNRNCGNALDAGGDAKALYRRAVDLLIHLHQTFDKEKARSIDLPIFSAALFASQVETYLDYYFPYVKGREATREEGEEFRAAWRQVLKSVDQWPQTLMLRDFMPDNLMDLKDREGWRSLGVLDFQDGGLGPAAYDLASLCEVVRRDGGDQYLHEMIEYYYNQMKPTQSLAEFKNICILLSLQRHMRILGVIVRLAQKTGRQEKLAFIPRIQSYVQDLVDHPALLPLKVWLQQTQS